jgi:hypothetical protein
LPRSNLDNSNSVNLDRRAEKPTTTATHHPAAADQVTRSDPHAP